MDKLRENSKPAGCVREQPVSFDFGSRRFCHAFSGRRRWQRLPWLTIVLVFTLSEVAKPSSVIAYDIIHRPIRVVTLVTGEQFAAEWSSGDSQELLFGYPGRSSIPIRREFVRSIANPAGVVDVREGHNFEVSPAHPWLENLARPFSSGVLEIWPERESAGPRSMSLTLSLISADRTPHEWEVIAADETITSASAPLETTFRQPLGTADWGKEPLQFVWDQQDWSLLLGDSLLARGHRPHVEVTGVSLKTSLPTTINSLILREMGQETGAVPPADNAQDILQLTDGSLLFGSFDEYQSAGIRWQSTEGTRITVPWSEFVAIHFRRRGLSHGAQVVGRTTMGRISEIQRPTRTIPIPLPAQYFLAAEHTENDWQHPLFRSDLSFHDGFSRIRPRWSGSLTWLCPEPVHLGDEHETHWPQPEPLKHPLFGEWELTQLPQGNGWIAADFSELEPSGDGTPPDQPFLLELQRGELVTSLWVNGQWVADWNRLLSWKPPVDTPERLRIPVPDSYLKIGVNRWEIRQMPLQTTAQRDDCLMQRLSWEVVVPDRQ